MQYTLLIYGEESAWRDLPDGEREAFYGEYRAFMGELEAQGKLRAGRELQPVATATSIRVRDGETLVSDGPFAETKDVLGGFFVIDSESLDEAIQWASRIPTARTGTIEIRPAVDHSEDER